MHARGRSQKRVHHGDRTDGRDPAPAFCHGGVNTQYARPKRLHDSLQPYYKRARLVRILGPNSFDTLPDLAEGQRTQEDVPILDAGPPRGNGGMAARPFSDLRDDVRVNKPGHSSTARPMSRGRSRSIPSSGADSMRPLRLRACPGLNRRKSKARASAACPGSARAATTARSSGASSSRTCTSRRCRPRLRSRFLCSANAALGGVRGFDGEEGRCFGIPEIYPEYRKNARNKVGAALRSLSAGAFAPPVWN